MTRIQYAGVGTPPAPTVFLNSGGITETGVKSFFLQSRARGGYSLLSNATEVTLTGNSSITITIPSAISQDGWDLKQVVLLMADGASANPADAVIIAEYENVEVLPGQIILTDDEHLVLGGIVNNYAQLPTNPINGTRRYVNSDSLIYRYNESQITWETAQIQEFTTYISSTTDINQLGCNRDFRNIGDELGIIKPDYDTSSGGYGEPVIYWLYNDGTAPVPTGTRVRIAVEVDGEDYSSKFDGKLAITPIGYANLNNGTLDTTNLTVGNRLDYQGDIQTNLLLEKPLPVGQAFAFIAELNYSEYEASEVVYGSTVRLAPRFASQFSKYEEALGYLFGDCIFPTLKYRRIVPTFNGAKVLEGRGSVNSYTFPNLGEQPLVNLAANTANQLAAISSDGTVFITDDVPNNAALRAIVGNVNGVGFASDFSNNINLDSNTLLTVNITHPTIIRSDYPDVIANSTDGEFNGKNAVIYVKNTTSGAIIAFESEDFIQGENNSSFTIGVNSGSNVPSTSLPEPLSPDFGLFNPDNFTVNTTTGTSVFASGIYQVAIAYRYENDVTQISHSADLGCIYEVDATIAEVFAFAGRSNRIFYSDQYPLINSAPPPTLGRENDAYLDIATKNLWRKLTSWENLGTLAGSDGQDGLAATITIDSVETVPNGFAAEIENIGNATNAILIFKIPAGEPGEYEPQVQEFTDNNNLSIDLTNTTAVIINYTTNGSKSINAANFIKGGEYTLQITYPAGTTITLGSEFIVNGVFGTGTETAIIRLFSDSVSLRGSIENY